MTIAVKVCERCSTGMTNNDWTFLDADSDGGETDEYAAIMASVAALGIAIMSDPVSDGYFSCWVCGADEIGGYLWLTETLD